MAQWSEQLRHLTVLGREPDDYYLGLGISTNGPPDAAPDAPSDASDDDDDDDGNGQYYVTVTNQWGDSTQAGFSCSG